MPDTLDAIVIGGGPAGGASALHLARLGWRTALVERGPEGRDKACGHCLGARAGPLLARLGLLERVERVAHGRTRRVVVRAPGARSVEAPLARAESDAGWIVDRRSLDALILSACEETGVRVVRPGWARVSVFGEDQVTVEVREAGRSWSARAGLVVGADGLRSGVARAAGLFGRAVTGRKFGFALDVRPADGGAIGEGTITLFLGPCGGYLGAVRRADGLVHLGGLVEAGARRGPEEFIEELARTHAGLRRLVGERLRTAGEVVACGPMACAPERVACAGVALVGDAAGYIEPFTGEGMAWALDASEALGEVCAGARPGAWGAREARAYAALWRARVGRRGVVCRALGAALERPFAMRLAARAASAGPAIVRALARRVTAA